MSFKFSPLSLSTLFVLHICTGAAVAQNSQQKCDEQAMSELLRVDEASNLDRFSQACGDSVADPRGFTLYDRARLAGSTNIANALSKENRYNEGSYSPAMGKLIQTGLRFLNFDAGIIDGDLGDRSLAAIQRYQKKYGFSEDGKLHNDWLADFYRRVIKKTQQELTDLGFDAGGADGIIGPNTITALQAFRQERQLPVADYRQIDGQLLYQLMMMEHEKNKKELAKRDAERAARRAAQEAARRKEIARAREEAQRRAEAERRAAEAAAIAAEQQREAEERRLKLLDIAAEKNQAEERLAAEQRAQALALKQQQVQAQQAAEAQARAQQESAQRAAEEARQQQQAQAARQQALVEAQAKAEAERAKAAAEQARIAQEKAAAERAAAEQKAREEQARQAALAAKAAEEQAAREAAASAKAAEQARREAQKALRAAKNDQPVELSQDMVRATSVQGAVPTGKGFSELKGILQFSSPTTCTVAGQPIESSWCESYHPSGNGKQCTVVMSKSGLVLSFLCD
ncbi:hypothetical protein KRX19_05280 [Cardiobacteriaceae bacterium TAE3-ERU3]|nr:hypothetical protein [Cardiobacteriaceae bacterium TAE3-ERU3]